MVDRTFSGLSCSVWATIFRRVDRRRVVEKVARTFEAMPALGEDLLNVPALLYKKKYAFGAVAIE